MSAAQQMVSFVADVLAQQPNPAPAPPSAGVALKDFESLPKWVIPLAASIIFLSLFKRAGDKVSASDNKYLDLGLDFGTLASAGSIVAVISTWPLMQSATKTIQSAVSKIDFTIPGTEFHVGSTLVLAIGVGLLGWWYTAVEEPLPLVLFGIAAQVLATTWPWINNIFGFVLNWLVRWVWWAIVKLIDLIPSIQFNVTV